MSNTPFLPYGRQTIEPDDVEAVVRALSSDFLTTGPEISSFEQELCQYTGAKFAVAVANGTAALHLAVLALDLPEGSIGVTSPNTFVATSNALLYAGHIPHFVDIHPQSYVLDPERLQTYLTTNKAQVVLPVHFAGNTFGVEKIHEIARKRGLLIIEDAAHSIGGSYLDGSKVGSCKYSDLTTFSFHPVKTMTTGEGGAITTNNPDLYTRLMTLRTHGIVREPNRMSKNPGSWYYEMQMLGYNYRITDIQAALGRSQLKKLDRNVNRRSEIVQRYNEAFQPLPWITTPVSEPGRRVAWHLYVVQLNWRDLGLDRPSVMLKLKELGIGSQVLYIPVPEQPYYKQQFPSDAQSYTHAQKYYDHALALPLYPSMSEDDQSRVIEAVKNLG
jgi:UDP-4-amino-4,6-dideoxy-N-acetyl-beta-L-altrosamine transaminase